MTTYDPTLNGTEPLTPVTEQITHALGKPFSHAAAWVGDAANGLQNAANDPYTARAVQYGGFFVAAAASGFLGYMLAKGLGKMTGASEATGVVGALAKGVGALIVAGSIFLGGGMGSEMLMNGLTGKFNMTSTGEAIAGTVSDAAHGTADMASDGLHVAGKVVKSFLP